MIATNVIKIDGKWYKAGEVIPEKFRENLRLNLIIPRQILTE